MLVSCNPNSLGMIYPTCSLLSTSAKPPRPVHTICDILVASLYASVALAVFMPRVAHPVFPFLTFVSIFHQRTSLFVHRLTPCIPAYTHTHTVILWAAFLSPHVYPHYSLT
ncbi:hypothetical protein CSKR_200712 [Clonorchis sinensis]|uniref:Uncharacterized protein n=1 Tax=Clonorchis sinensis TaxID=79923 RepID=A0A8T1MHA7_CLOSI|nr:hypothetical protein CSKR_200712 [Clonorchis sinensis]